MGGATKAMGGATKAMGGATKPWAARPSHASQVFM
jgi:hypothetical protein